MPSRTTTTTFAAVTAAAILAQQVHAGSKILIIGDSMGEYSCGSEVSKKTDVHYFNNIF